MTGQRHRVVVVGGGFGGINVTRALARADVDVTIVDRTNHHLFQPLLYQVATGILSEGLIAPPLRGVIRNQANTRTVLAEVTRIRPGRQDGVRRVTRRPPATAPLRHAGRGRRRHARLLRARRVGRVRPWHEDTRGCPRLRSRILSAFEMAETAADPENARHSSRSSSSARDRPGWNWSGRSPSWPKQVLPRSIAGSTPARRRGWCWSRRGPAVLGPFDPKLQRYTQRRLEKMGVEVRVDTAATAMTDDSITVKGPGGQERIAARTKIWAAGVQASPLAKMLPEATGARPTARAGWRCGRTAPCPGIRRCSPIGDMVSLNGLPGVAQPAMQEGKYVGKLIRARLNGGGTVAAVQVLRQGQYGDHRSQRPRSADAFGMRFTGADRLPDVGLHPRPVFDRLGQPDGGTFLHWAAG